MIPLSAARPVYVSGLIIHGSQALIFKPGDSPNTRPHQWVLPGGYLNPKEALYDGFQRVVLGLTGLDIRSIHWQAHPENHQPVWINSRIHPDDSHGVIACYYKVVSLYPQEPPATIPHPRPLHEFRWVSVVDLTRDIDLGFFESSIVRELLC